MGTGGSFPGGKARPGRDGDYSPPSSAEVMTEKEMYLLSPSWRVVGQLYLFTSIIVAWLHSHVSRGAGQRAVSSRKHTVAPSHNNSVFVNNDGF
jgi:hypothetical protein